MCELIHASNDLRPTKSQAVRNWTFIGTVDGGRLTLVRDGKVTCYDVLRDGDGFLLAKDGSDESYRVACGGSEVKCCTCKGWYYSGRCVHSATVADWLASEVFQEQGDSGAYSSDVGYSEVAD